MKCMRTSFVGGYYFCCCWLVLFKTKTSLAFVSVDRRTSYDTTTTSITTVTTGDRYCGRSSVNVIPNQDQNEIETMEGGRGTTRRSFSNAIVGGLVSFPFLTPTVAEAKGNSQNSIFTVLRKGGVPTDTLKTGVVDTTPTVFSSERCLLKLLPVNNKVFRKLESYIEELENLRSPLRDDIYWASAYDTILTAIQYLDNQRRFLEPLFNQEETTLFQIEKAERGERLIETLRNELLALANITKTTKNDTVFDKQKDALLALSDIGELLVGTFPYDVPTDGKFAFLPRLLGRCCVTLTFKRDNDILGNVTIIADGFAAPITAGNFVDLSLRQFYTGLPVKAVTKKLGGLTSIRTGFLRFETVELETNNEDDTTTTTAPVPILGSYREGFYDPLTAKPRRIPLETLRYDKATGVSELTYARGFADLSSTEAVIGTYRNSKPILSFDIPGLIALNHPDKNVNGGSSEFFALQQDTIPEDKRTLLDGQYSPFGYIIDGLELYQNLKEGDIISATDVGKWGQLNLVKIKGSKFSDLAGKEGDET